MKYVFCIQQHVDSPVNGDIQNGCQRKRPGCCEVAIFHLVVPYQVSRNGKSNMPRICSSALKGRCGEQFSGMLSLGVSSTPAVSTKATTQRSLGTSDSKSLGGCNRARWVPEAFLLLYARMSLNASKLRRSCNSPRTSGPSHCQVGICQSDNPSAYTMVLLQSSLQWRT